MQTISSVAYILLWPFVCIHNIHNRNHISMSNNLNNSVKRLMLCFLIKKIRTHKYLNVIHMYVCLIYILIIFYGIHNILYTHPLYYNDDSVKWSKSIHPIFPHYFLWTSFFCTHLTEEIVMQTWQDSKMCFQ